MLLHFLPTFNALCNALCAICLFGGYRAIKRRDPAVHQRFMLSALACSATFLLGYLTRMALTGAHSFGTPGLVRNLYLLLLVSHMILAVVMLPMIFRALFLASRARFAEHKRLAKVTLPIWLYVSITGVIVYIMLYHVAPRLT